VIHETLHLLKASVDAPASPLTTLQAPYPVGPTLPLLQRDMVVESPKQIQCG
jgi:hypothetical protein